VKKIIFFFLIFLFYPRQIIVAATDNYVTVVNPVRARNLWQSVDSVKNQINLILDYKIPSTWLLQYDVIIDDEAWELFKKLPNDQELGVFLEVSERLATDGYVPYLLGMGDWARPDKVLLSGYLPDERKRIIDKLFEKFKSRFGLYPVSVGAWYIDTLSLDYLAEKYNIQTVLDVADQYSTDKYGIWGKPWGLPYIPSRLNSLLPAKNEQEKMTVVKIQWAQRDPVRGFGSTVADSNFSMQANDYINNKLDTNYFKKLTGVYLGLASPIKQLTVGLEAGQEGAVFYEEFKKQLQYLKQLQGKNEIVILTMKLFAKEYNNRFPLLNPGVFISGTDYFDPSIEAYWYSSRFYRIGLIKQNNKLFIRDFRIYPDYLPNRDIFTNDLSVELKRVIPGTIDEVLKRNSKMLFSDVTNIKIINKNDKIDIYSEDKKGNEHLISLLEDKVVVEGKAIFEKDKQSGFKDDLDRFLSRTIVDYWVKYPHEWFGSWRFSKINNKFYFGFMISPDYLTGIKSEFPLLGSFQFPFQTLIRFKSFPKLGIAEFISDYLVKSINNSTIKISEKHLL